MSRRRRRGFAQTSADASDARLRGRTYAIPFEDVWQAALKVTGGGLFRWTRLEEDNYTGEIRACSKSLLGALHDIEIRVGLDENGQTRVDATAAAHRPLGDFGRSSRRLRRFFRALDKTLDRRGDRTATAPRSSKAAPRP